MAIGYTELDFINGAAPALNAANMNHIDEGVKACADTLDTQGVLTPEGRADANAIAAATGATLSARIVGIITVGIKAIFGFVANAVGFEMAGGTTSKKLTVDADASTSNVPTLAGKTAADAIGAATGATTALKLANLASPASPTQQGVALLGASGGAAKLTKMPDGATAVYSNDAFDTGHGWTADGAMDMLATGGTLRMTRKASGGTGAGGLTRGISGIPGKTVWVKYRYSSLSATDMAPVAVCGYVGGYFDVLGTLAPSLSYAVAPLQVPLAGVSLNGLYFRSASGIASAWFEVKAVWIGDYSYLPGSLSEEAARIADQLGDTPGVGVAASGTITATDLATATKGDTIAGKKYTYVAALTASPGVEGEVLKGATKEDDLENLNLAISEAARTNNGTKYWAAAVHPLVSSTRNSAILTLTAKSAGLLGNQITTVCEAGTNHTASGSTLSGGKDAVGDKIHTQLQTMPASTAKYGASLLAADGGTTAGTAVQGNDSRLAKAPTTWTPVPSFGDVTDDGTRTTVINSVIYIGKMAYCEFIITWTAKGTKTGEFKIKGFPANPASGANTLPVGNLYCTNMTGLTAGVARNMVLDNDSLRFRTWTATGLDSISFSDTVFTNTSSIRGRFSYQIA